MRAFKTKSFARLARREGLGDDALRKAIVRAEQGLIDADLGGNVIKQRAGLRGSHRVIVVFRAADRAVFAFVFAKSRRANLKKDEVESYQKLANMLLGFTDKELDDAVDAGELVEIRMEDDE